MENSAVGMPIADTLHHCAGGSSTPVRLSAGLTSVVMLSVRSPIRSGWLFDSASVHPRASVFSSPGVEPNVSSANQSRQVDRGSASLGSRSKADRRFSDHFRVASADWVVVAVMMNPFNILQKPTIQRSAQKSGQKSGQQPGRRALVGETTIAEAADTQRVDGYEYFPPDAVRWEFLEPSERTSVCAWKGVANYYDVIVDGDRLPAAAWTYKTPSAAANHIGGHVAFWRGVRVVRAD